MLTLRFDSHLTHNPVLLSATKSSISRTDCQACVICFICCKCISKDYHDYASSEWIILIFFFYQTSCVFWDWILHIQHCPFVTQDQRVGHFSDIAGIALHWHSVLSWVSEYFPAYLHFTDVEILELKVQLYITNLVSQSYSR